MVCSQLVTNLQLRTKQNTAVNLIGFFHGKKIDEKISLFPSHKSLYKFLFTIK